MTDAKFTYQDLEAGIQNTDEDPRHQPSAYAMLGETSVAVYRGDDGKVYVEIQDEADEEVYVSINALPVYADDSEASKDHEPWNREAIAFMREVEEEERNRVADIQELLKPASWEELAQREVDRGNVPE